MEIKLHRIGTDFKGEYCYVAPKGVLFPNGDIFVITMPLLLSGVDTFYNLETFVVDGKTFEHTPFKKHENMGRKRLPDGREMLACDFTSIYHKATGKMLIIGMNTYYTAKNESTGWANSRQTTYAVYDEKTGDFSEVACVQMDDEKFFNAGNGSGQCHEEENGDILIPFFYLSKSDLFGRKYNYTTAVKRCSFDGEKLTVKEIGSPLVITKPRGLYEASLIKYKNEYFLCLRNDHDGYLAKSTDGLHYDEPQPLCFDDGESVGNYCTQQHWLVGGGKLWLVYTRRGADNDHVFRHRAPLFIAEVDPVTLRVIRATEKIAVPNRGARLGNFGCFSEDDKRGFVVASEWMQYGGGDKDGWKKCMEYGSDNSIFIAEILFD